MYEVSKLGLYTDGVRLFFSAGVRRRHVGSVSNRASVVAFGEA